MTKEIVIDPVTRIEGHAKITVFLNDSGEASEAQLHVTQLRGFEKFVEGRPFHEMPALTARICGICPVSHLMAAAKAGDSILAVKIPPTAKKLRRIMNMGQHIQSHALNFFHLSSPDLLLGFDSDPAKRNIFGVLKDHPELARDGIRLRAFGQKVIEFLGGKRIHPSWAVPGGVSSPLTIEVRDKILALLPEAKSIALKTIGWYKQAFGKYTAEIQSFANFPSLFLGMVTPQGGLEQYDGLIRITDENRKIVADKLEHSNYQSFIGEAAETWSFLKFPYYKPMGYPDGNYRVGPLARLNIIDKCGTPEADKEFLEFKQLDKGAVKSSFHYHYARLIEILFSIEKMEQLLHDKDILSTHVRATGGVNAFEGIGASEAPRGILFHHYKVDENGLMKWCNLIIATGHNNLSMNKGITQVAKHFVKGAKIQEGMLNRVEAVVRAFDPCLSCSTHSLGKMPLQIQLIDPEGKVADQTVR